MNLIQQLSSAALDATKSQLSSSKAASTPGQQNAHSTATVSALLDQLASSIASIQHQQQQQQQQQQQSLDSTAGAGKGLGPTASAGDFVHQVQAGLQASNEQLQRLLSQPIRVPLTPQGADGAAAFKQAISSPLSLEVLQNLLQLAVGSRCLSCKVQSEPSWQSGQQQQQQQQDDWHRAAWEAVQLFSFQELEQLPPDSLQQALLLHPQLLDSFLEAAAAAVLQPVLQCSTNNVTTSSHTTLITATQQHHMEVNSGSSLHKDSGSDPVAGSGGVKNMQSLLSASCPWVQHLPDMLAHNPLLLLKASSTLLSWFEASGHVRLLQLLSTICRPAWQQLAAAAAAESSQCPANAAVPASPAGSASCSAGGCGMNTQTDKQRMSAGRLELLCPLPWQQQLVIQLAQEPSVEGLLVLLHRLPGLAAAQQPHHHQQQQQKTEGGPMEVDGGTGVNRTAAAGAAADWTNDELLAWPQPREWGQPAAAAAAGQRDQDCSKDQQQQQQQQQAAVQDRSEVLLAWGLVVQHHCWYQFACALLVRSSLQYVQHCHQQQQQQQQQDWTTMVQQLEQLLGSSEVNRQRQAHASSGPLAAAAAAAFIAWVHQPAHLQRQSSLMQRLLSAVSTAASSSSSVGGGGGGSGDGGGNAMQQKQPDVYQAANCLLNAWTVTLKGQQQQQQQQSVTTGSCHCSGMSVTPALYMCDLPCAVLQQKQLLLGCTPGQLVSMCIEAASSDLRQQQQQSGKQCGVAGSTAAAGVFPVEVQCQLLDCSNDLCAAALEVVNVMVQHKARPPSPLQQQQGSNAAAASFSSAAASLSCLARQWLEDDDAAASITDYSNMVHQGSGMSSIVPDLAVAKPLLAAATGVDQQLKQYAQGHVAT